MTQNQNDSARGRAEPESELYFGDASSFTVSVHNDNGNGSAMYEEIQSHRYDTLQRPANDGMVGQRTSWDGYNQRLPPASGIHAGQPRTRHSADTVGKAKIFSPIVVPKFINCPSSGASSWVSNQTEMTDSSSFVPYRRAAVQAADSGRYSEEVYENVTNLDFDDKKPRALSPDEEVAIITSQFIDNDIESTQLDSETEDQDSNMRAVNV